MRRATRHGHKVSMFASYMSVIQHTAHITKTKLAVENVTSIMRSTPNGFQEQTCPLFQTEEQTQRARTQHAR